MTAQRTHSRVVPPAVPPPRRHRFPDPTLVGAGGIAAGLLLAWLHHPRLGLYVVGMGVGALAVLRLVLPARDAGLLVVRGRAFDVAVLAVLGAALVVIASVTPFPAPGA